MTDTHWCTCGDPMVPVIHAARGMTQVAWYCTKCGRWEWIID